MTCKHLADPFIWSVTLELRAELIALDFALFAENFNKLELLCVDGDLLPSVLGL